MKGRNSSMGGSGAHRWADPATWEPSENAAVQLYNVLRGIRYDGQWFYGLQGVTAAQLPAAHWIAQVNKCAATILGASGPEPLYRSSGEIPVSAEIHTVIEGFLTACNGRLSDAGGVYKLYAGAPDAPVATLTDDDILSTSDQSFTPFLGLAETVNGVSAKYPSPAAGWQVETAPPLYNPDFEAEDGGRRLLVDVALDFVPYAEQAQRLMQAALNEARRARRHTFHLPPKFWPLEPGDVIAWTSERNGYQSKQFRVDGVIDLPDADVIVDLTEVDPADYAFDSATDFTPPAEPGVLPQAIPVQEVEGFAVSPASLNDETGTGRRPAILAVWNGDLADVRAVVFELRVAATGEAVDPARSDTVSDGHVYISNGILPAVTYEVRAQFIPESPRPTEWTLWQGVTAPDLRLGADDLATVINNQLAAVDVLADDLATVEETANGVRQDHDVLVSGFLGGDLATAFQGVDLDVDAIVEQITGLLPSDFKGGARYWQSASSALAAIADTAFPIAYDASLLANAVTLGPANSAIAPHGVIEVQPDRVYEIEFKARVASDGATGSANCYLGFYGWDDAGTLIHSNHQPVAFVITPAEGVIHGTVIVAGAIASVSPGLADTTINAACTQLRPHFRANASNLTDALVNVSMLAIREITGKAKADYTDARLTQDYYTSAGTDGAISAATTSLQSTMEGPGGSVTAAQDAAQAASDLAGSKGKVLYQSAAPAAADRGAQNLWIDTTSASNTPKRWNGTAWVAVTDKVATDAAAAAAAAQNSVNSLSATLTQDYYTRASTDSAISKARQELEAEISSVEQSTAAFHEVLNAHDPAKVGAAVGASTGAAALGQTGTVLITENATARDAGGATNGYYLSIPTDKALQFAARRIKVSVLARRPSTNAATAFGVSYSTAEVGNSGAISFALSTNWAWHTFYYDVPPPLAGGFDYIGIFGDDSKTGKATEVARVQVEIAAEAAALPEISELQGDITNIYALDANGLNGTVFGAMLNELNVAGNGKIAGVDNFGTAMADLHGNVSASYLLRARAGGQTGELEVVAWDDASGGGSAIFLSAEYIFAKGTLSANLLTVGNNDNLLSNTDYADGLISFLQNTNGASGAETAMSIRPSTASWTDGVRPVLELGQLGSSAAGFSDVIFRRVLGHGGLGFIEVEPSESYEFSAYVSTHRCTAQMYVQWRNAANTVVSTDVLPIPEDGGSSTDPLSWQRPFLIKKAPASAKFANLFIRKYGTLSGTSSYLFVHHPMFALTHADATQPSKYVPKGITYVDGQQIITGSVTADKMSVNELSAISANIGHFKSAASGERIEIMDDVIKVFDAGGQVRVKIGNLLA